MESGVFTFSTIGQLKTVNRQTNIIQVFALHMVGHL